MERIATFLAESDDVQTIAQGIREGFKEQLVAGLANSTRSLFIAALQKETPKKMIIITHQLLHAQQLHDDLIEFSDNKSVYLYPVNELTIAEMAIASPEMSAQRIHALQQWLDAPNGILITPVAALKRILPPLSFWLQYQFTFRDGMQIDLEEYVQTFVQMGYRRVDMVHDPGDFSVRGGIIDIFPVTEEHPVRIELFDDEIDSLRFFDAQTQRSKRKTDEVKIGPAKEIVLRDEERLKGAERLEKKLVEHLQKLKASEKKEKLLQTIEEDVRKLKDNEDFPELNKYISLFYDEASSLLDYLPEDGLIIFDEWTRVQEAAENLDKEELELTESLLEQAQMLPNVSLSFSWESVREKMTKQIIYMSLFLRHTPNTQPKNVVNFSSRAMQEFHGQMNLFKSELARWQNGNYSVFIFVADETRAQKVHSILHDYGMEIAYEKDFSVPSKRPIIAIGDLQSGIDLPLHKLALITENELFKKKQPRKRRSVSLSNAERIKSYQELKPGDYVVHRDHGIGKYIGIKTLEVNDLHQDYLLIQYSGDDKLYVPVDQIELVQKYVGSEGKEPRMYKLGGTEWAKVKRRVQSSVEDIADELIKLYAERQAQKGHAFEKDTDLQREFEQAFPYQETEDQLRCVQEIKRDMESSKPMDRLLCGDVGYGKTEVAIRAIFKAVMDGKQAAVLVPTTILAQQHYQTMIERFQDYPVNIGLLSRFRTRKQQKETLEMLQKGTLDIIIGTHRLLSDDVVYHDLGLLVIDEEQRFGVKHKEKIKQIKTNVDVLTLTATPIPRTLHMSMLGIRDLSLIETPPENRFPVQTYVIEHNLLFIREAIERELARGGQVFLLYNRIEDIEKVAKEVAEIVEDANIAIAHGRMNETELENVMLQFLDGEIDVLVSTTIIETGVDIPNVNTLIVYDADHMGLSQLYQLRGRVGRSNRIAYAYFTYRKDKILTEVAEKRLQAIKEFTELGSGFKIAMRDLSIRGAGNLLGAEQHGFIDSVGFDLYSQMLKEAIESRKQGKPIEDVQPFTPELNVKLDAYIPSYYIEDEKQKIDMYKRFQHLESNEEIIDLQDELIDRFGDYPKEVEQLFLVSRLKMVAKKERIEQVTESKNKIELLMEEERSQQIDGAKLFEYAHAFGNNVRLGTAGNKLKITFHWKNESRTERYDQVCSFIEKLDEVNREESKTTSSL